MTESSNDPAVLLEFLLNPKVGQRFRVHELTGPSPAYVSHWHCRLQWEIACAGRDYIGLASFRPPGEYRRDYEFSLTSDGWITRKDFCWLMVSLANLGILELLDYSPEAQAHWRAQELPPIKLRSLHAAVTQIRQDLATAVKALESCGLETQYIAFANPLVKRLDDVLARYSHEALP